jgi:Raf kinase inhibitor-like YbhB/YbcL family protein
MGCAKKDHMRIDSPAFKDGTAIPDRYTCFGKNKIPPLRFEEVPEDAQSLALIVEDPDAPAGTFTHWVLFNLDPQIRDIREGVVPLKANQGTNDFGGIHYDGPKPPSGEHRYCFKAFAVDAILPLSNGAGRGDVERELDGHVIDSAILVGTYAR